MSGYKPGQTGVSEGKHTSRLVLLVNTIDDESGDQLDGATTDIVIVEGINGSPEGVSTGSPGDLRFRRDVAEIWQKATGVRTKTGWERVASVAGGGVESRSFSRNVFSVSNEDLMYFSFSSNQNAAISQARGLMISPLIDLGIGAQKLMTRAGRLTAIMVRSTVQLPTINFFVEIDVGGGFVLTQVATGVTVPANTLFQIPIASPPTLPSGASIRVGFDNTDGNTINSVTMNAEIEISYP